MGSSTSTGQISNIPIRLEIHATLLLWFFCLGHRYTEKIKGWEAKSFFKGDCYGKLDLCGGPVLTYQFSLKFVSPYFLLGHGYQEKIKGWEVKSFSKWNCYGKLDLCGGRVSHIAIYLEICATQQRSSFSHDSLHWNLCYPIFFPVRAKIPREDQWLRSSTFTIAKSFSKWDWYGKLDLREGRVSHIPICFEICVSLFFSLRHKSREKIKGWKARPL